MQQKQPVLSLDSDTLRIYRQEGVIRYRGTIRLYNTGNGILIGSIHSSSPWIQVLVPRIETPYLHILSVFLAADQVPDTELITGLITIVSNGGTRTVSIELMKKGPLEPVLSIHPRRLFLRDVDRSRDSTSAVTLRNAGKGMLKGTITSQVPWFTPGKEKFSISDSEEIILTLNPEMAPQRPLCTGFLDIVSDGGQERVFVTVSFAKEKNQKPSLYLPVTTLPIRITEKCRQHETTFTIKNSGTGILSGTITFSSPAISVQPSRFSLRDEQKIRVLVQESGYTGTGPRPLLTISSNGGSKTVPVLLLFPKQRSGTVRISRKKNRTIQLYDEFANPVRLTATGKSGGEGEIFLIDGRDNLCAKIYFANKKTPFLTRKIQAMVNNPPPGDVYEYLAWPVSLLYDSKEKNSLAGFVMQRVHTGEYLPLHHYYDPQDRALIPCIHTPDSDRLMVYRIALSLAFVVHEIHAAGHCIGDLRETNIFANVSGSVILIDCDSFQVRDRDKKQVFSCEVGTGEYLPPELLDLDLARRRPDRYHADLYALAVLIFKLLMDGVHPFQAKGKMLISAPTTIDKVRIGCFSFARPRRGISPPDYAPDYSQIPGPVAALFSRCFIDGYHVPSRRPGAAEWCSVLQGIPGYRRTVLRRTDDPAGSPISPGKIPQRKKTYKERKPRPAIQKCRQETEPVPLSLSQQDLCYTSEKKCIVLKNRLFQSGKRSLWTIQKSRSLVATVYHVPGIPESIEEKISVMIRNPPPDSRLCRALSWPQAVLYRDPDCSLSIGFLMHATDRTRFFEIHACYDPVDRIARFSEEFSFRHLIITGANLAGLIASLHAGGHRAAGSLSIRSLLVSQDCSVHLIHSDAFQVRDPDTGLFLPAGALENDLCPPEWGNTGNISDGTDLYPADLFGLAVLLFRLLMDGVHPFMIAPDSKRKEQTLSERIQEGLYPYTARDDIRPPLFAPSYARIPLPIRKLFDSCFLKGEDPDRRPSALLWHTTLRRVSREILQCSRDKTHWFMPDDGSCPWCEGGLPDILPVSAFRKKDREYTGGREPVSERVTEEVQEPMQEKVKECISCSSPEGEDVPVCEPDNHFSSGYSLYYDFSTLLLHLIDLPFTPRQYLLANSSASENNLSLVRAGSVLSLNSRLSSPVPPKSTVPGEFLQLQEGMNKINLVLRDARSDEKIDIICLSGDSGKGIPTAKKTADEALTEEQKEECTLFYGSKGKISFGWNQTLPDENNSSLPFGDEGNSSASEIPCPGNCISSSPQIQGYRSFSGTFQKADPKRAATLLQWLSNDSHRNPVSSLSEAVDLLSHKDGFSEISLIDEFHWHSTLERQKGMVPFISGVDGDEEMPIEEMPMMQADPLYRLPTVIPVRVVPGFEERIAISGAENREFRYVTGSIVNVAWKRIVSFVKRTDSIL
ncbi:MAG: hypothetical protein JXA44_07980 [Methanospirillaceae archaeon]|nr:hypothetical protein [Methanospirillaceae archaeon]